MKPVSKCKSCIAAAAKDLLDRAQNTFRRQSAPEQSLKGLLPRTKENMADVRSVTSDPQHSQHRGRRQRRSLSLSRSRSRKSSFNPETREKIFGVPALFNTVPQDASSFRTMSPLSYHRQPIPNPNATRLPSLAVKDYRRFSTDVSPKRWIPNIPSRTAQITTSSVPQLDWTGADCRDWLTLYLSEYGYTMQCARMKASKSPECGEGIYHTSLWHWKDRMGFDAGTAIYHHLQQCSSHGLVASGDEKNCEL